jgi:hypothetical protein
VKARPFYCANPSCQKRRGTLPEGRAFAFEIVSISVAASDHPGVTDDDEIPQRERVHFWLCETCCQAATLTLDPSQGLQLVVLDKLCDHAQAS